MAECEMAKIEGKTLAIKAKVMRLRVRTSSSPDLIYYLQYFPSHMSSIRVFFFSVCKVEIFGIGWNACFAWKLKITRRVTVEILLLVECCEQKKMPG